MTPSNAETTTPLSALARRDVLRASPTDTIGSTARRMHTAGFSAVIVIENDQPIGIWTEADALRVDLADPASREQPLEAVMSRPVAFLPPEASIIDARARLEGAGIRHLLIRGDDGTPLGILNQRDLVGALESQDHLHLQTVRAAQRRGLVRLSAKRSLSEAARRMIDNGQKAMVVDFPEGDPGVVSERDVVRVLAEEPGDPGLAAVANRPLVTVTIDDNLLTAYERMLSHDIRHVAITESDGHVTGLLGFGELLTTSEASLVKQLEASLANTRARLHEEKMARQSAEAARKRREEEAAAFYEAMFRNNPAPGLLIDAESGAITDANPAALAFYGYSDGAIRQLRFQDIDPLSESTLQAESRHHLANGEIRDVRVVSSPVVINGHTHLHAIIHDDTEAGRL